MLKFVEKFICLIVCLFLMEMSLYIKDSNEVFHLSNFIKYDIKQGNINNIKNNKYEVYFSEEDQVIKYEIVYYRNPLLKIRKFKNIRYYGEVDKSDI